MSRTSRIVMFVLLILGASLLYSCVEPVTYVYAKVFGRDVRVLETGDPPISYFWRGDPIPILYRMERDIAELTFTIGRETFIPSLRIQSTQPIHDIRTKGCGHVYSRSDLEYEVYWGYWRDPQEISCVNVDEIVELQIDVDGVEETIVVYGHIKESGVFYYGESL